MLRRQGPQLLSAGPTVQALLALRGHAFDLCEAFDHGSRQITPQPPHLPTPPAEAAHQCELSTYFAGPYLRGELLEAAQYSNRGFGEVGTFEFDAPDGPVQVWHFAFDLRELVPDDKELVVLYHYTDELAFRNVGNMEQSAAELYASLVDERAHFGQGVYATQHEPAATRPTSPRVASVAARSSPGVPSSSGRRFLLQSLRGG